MGRWRSIPRNPRNPIQGQLGNCWLVAWLSAIARVRPEHIEDMIEPLDDGRYRVTFQRYDTDAGAYVPDPVVVTPNFYRDLFRPAYGGSRNSGQRGRMELWFPIVEKAYAQLRGGYRATRSGTGVDAFERILGAPAKQLGHTLVEPSFLFTSLRDALQARLPLHTATPKDLSTIDARHRAVTEGLVANHAYTILDTYEEGGERYVRLRNPHGSGTPSGGARGVFALPIATFMATFDHSMIGTIPRSERS